MSRFWASPIVRIFYFYAGSEKRMMFGLVKYIYIIDSDTKIFISSQHWGTSNEEYREAFW